MCVLVPKLCLTLCAPMNGSPPGSPVHRISQARILEWVAISFSRGSSRSRDRTCISCIGRQVFYHWATWEALAPWCVMLYIKALFNLCHFSNRMSSYCSLMKLILFIIIKIYSPLVFIFILYPFFKKYDYSIFFLLNWKSLLHTKDFLHQYSEARKI